MSKRTTILGLTAAIFLVSIMTGACGDSDGWTTIKPQGTSTTFELPEPVEHPEREGYSMYQSTTGMDSKNNKIQIGIWQRKDNLKEIIPPGTADADALELFETHCLDGLRANLAGQNLPFHLEFVKDLGVEKGLGQQYRMNSGDEFSINQFYLNPDVLIWVKIDNSDESNPRVKRFLDSIEP
ncbi:MAG: hypothetical protein IPM23_22830 [Candidatus Melainabacteria bacterium]|nr:hypothetical protein [Candidatus Melainabacteria bacterium]